METSVVGVTSYVQNEVTKYRAEIIINDKHYQKRGFIDFDEAVKYRKYLEETYLPEKIIRVESDEIVETYKKTESIRETARIHDMSCSKVRKLLITADAYSTKKSIEINKLLDEGLSTKEVAEKLNISVSSVLNLSVYRKGENNHVEPSKSALNNRKWRQKNKPPT
ncbi:DNA-binding response regulator [Enterococcus hailinensis]|uniref:DNA-binding response regulator n=1 Tax=Enterococcus hailinensis TaxID=3238988 RepID=UPI0038B30ADE